MQETKLADDDAPVMAFAMAGYDLVHHGEGRWNGVAIAVRQACRRRGRRHELRRRPRPRQQRRRDGLGQRGGLRPVRRGADGRRVDRERASGSSASTPRTAGSSARRSSPASSRWFERLHRWLRESCSAGRRRSSSAATSTSPRPTRTSGIRAPPTAGPTSQSPSEAPSERSSTGASSTPTGSRHDEPGRFTWWDYRAGMFHKNFGMRIDHLLVTKPRGGAGRGRRDRPRGAQGTADPVRPRAAHVDLDEPGKPFDADWDGAL